MPVSGAALLGLAAALFGRRAAQADVAAPAALRMGAGDGCLREGCLRGRGVARIREQHAPLPPPRRGRLGYSDMHRQTRALYGRDGGVAIK